MKTGKLTLKPWSIVSEVLYDKDTKRATGVRVLDAIDRIRPPTTRRRSSSSARRRSTRRGCSCARRPTSGPAGLGSSSGELGHNLMDHHFRVGAEGTLEGMDDKYYYGRRPNRLLHPALPQPVRRQARLPARVRLSGQRGPRRLVARGGASSASAARSRTRWRSPARGQSARTAFGEMLPNHANMVSHRRDEEGQVGTAGPQDRLRDRRERAARCART